MSGKGDGARPMNISREQFDANFDAIFKAQKLCGLCRKPVDKCGCCPTEDGPADKPAEGSDEVKTHYERRRFDREGV